MLKKHKTILIFIILCLILMTSACGQANATPSSTASITQTPAPTQAEPDYALTFNSAVLFGCEHAIVSAKFVPKNPDITEYGFIFSDTQETPNAILTDGILYATLSGLTPDTRYIYNIWYKEGEEIKTTPEAFSFTTPSQQLNQDQLAEYIEAELNGLSVDSDNRLLMEIQACMSLLGLDIDRYGKWGAITQANLTRIVYTANSLDNFVDYTHISAMPDEYALALLKDILCKDMLTNGEDFIRPFIPTPYALTSYAQLNDEGGSLDIETYITKQATLDEQASALLAEYPFDVHSDAFKTLYAETIADPAFSEDGRTEKLAGYAAKNKAMFSYKADRWMETIAQPKERLVTFAESENQITVNTFVGYAYLLIDAYRATGDVLVTSTTYRDLDKQWFFYSEKKDKSVAYRHNGSWHLKRQRFSYVPGFSNHQYGVAIDFYERNSFGDTDLFDYLNAHANDYGFYNYYLEPWHWVYLGKIF